MPTPQRLITQSTILFVGQTRQARLRQSIQSKVEASYSAVLTMAGFLLERYPGMRPPKLVGLEGEDDTGQNKEIKRNITFDRMYEPWCDYLADLFLRDKVKQQGGLCQFDDQVSDQFINQLGESLFVIQATANPSNGSPQSSSGPSKTSTGSSETSTGSSETSTGSPQPIQTSQTPLRSQLTYRPYLSHELPTPSSKKIGIINFATSQKFTNPTRPKMHLVGLFAGIFFQQGDHWKLFNVLKQDYPTKQEYMELDTIILSGSSLSVNDETPEVIKFIETLKEGINLNPKMKILGVCFGHQVLAKMFSGTVIQKHLLAGVQSITFNPMPQLPYFPLTTPPTFSLSQYHKDFVVQVPQNFSILAQSESCTIQSLVSHDRKFLSFQFHPEYSAEYIRAFEMRVEQFQGIEVDSPYCRDKFGSVKHRQSLWDIRKIIRSFIDWKVDEL